MADSAIVHKVPSDASWDWKAPDPLDAQSYNAASSIALKGPSDEGLSPQRQLSTHDDDLLALLPPEPTAATQTPQHNGSDPQDFLASLLSGL